MPLTGMGVILNRSSAGGTTRGVNLLNLPALVSWVFVGIGMLVFELKKIGTRIAMLYKKHGG